jgi:hypothetical protein
VHVADAFVSGGEAPAPVPPASLPTPATEAVAGEGAALEASNHLALVDDKRLDVQALEGPDVQASEDSDVRPLRAGIVHRASGRARRRTTVYFEPQLANRLKIYCVTQGLELSDLVDRAVRAHLDGSEHPTLGTRVENRSA